MDRLAAPNPDLHHPNGFFHLTQSNPKSIGQICNPNAPAMSILSRNLMPNPTSRATLSPIVEFPSFPRISRSAHSSVSSHLQTLAYNRCKDAVSVDLLRNHRWRIKASESGSAYVEENREVDSFNFDSVLSLSELLLLVSSLVVSVGCLVNWAFLKPKNMGLVTLGSKILVWLLAGAVVVGAAIRRRQWRRVCGVPTKRYRGASEHVNVIERIEKLEESLRSATTIIRVLSRQLEKLGIRFRVTRKTLKDPIAETAALAQKNSEAARTLAAQEERLEKELSEVQKVLLAMQDQQQKQLELILAIAKNGNLFEPKREPNQGPNSHKSGDLKGKRLNQTVPKSSAEQKETNNDQV